MCSINFGDARPVANRAPREPYTCRCGDRLASVCKAAGLQGRKAARCRAARHGSTGPPRCRTARPCAPMHPRLRARGKPARQRGAVPADSIGAIAAPAAPCPRRTASPLEQQRRNNNAEALGVLRTEDRRCAQLQLWVCAEATCPYYTVTALNFEAPCRPVGGMQMMRHIRCLLRVFCWRLLGCERQAVC